MMLRKFLPLLAVLILNSALANKLCEKQPKVITAILDTLHMVGQPCDAVSDEKLLQVTSLYVVEQGLDKLTATDLAGLANLEFLNINNNYITNFDPGLFTETPKLRQIFAISNRLSKIEVGALAGLSNLEFLQLMANQIEEIQPGALTGLNKLRYLTLGLNRLGTLDATVFQGLNNLEILNLSSNMLEEFPLGLIDNLPLLNNFNVSQNYMSGFPVGFFSNIKQPLTVDVRGTYVTDSEAERIRQENRLISLTTD